jgi:Icc-related predicted phosphoesterase
MPSRRTFIVTAALSSLSLPRILAGLRLPEDGPTIGTTPRTICIVGDLQRTSDAEAVFMGRQENPRSRELIVQHIAKTKPDLLLLLGDQVDDGSEDSSWAFYDEVMKPITSQNIPTVAVIGNHDYGVTDRNRALANMYRHFPYTRQRPHVHSFGALGIIGFDSNLDQLSPRDLDRQQREYVKALDRFEADPNIHGVFVMCHHPPYSNSSLGTNVGVREGYALPFAQRTKTRIFMTGHVHSYERFIFNGKTYLVSGGGGGPRRMLSVGSDATFSDQYSKGNALRPFHYVRMHLDESTITAEVMMVQSDKLRIGDRFSMPLYEPSTATAK